MGFASVVGAAAHEPAVQGEVFDMIRQRAGCDCVVATIAMYCGVSYEAAWWALPRRDRWAVAVHGQGVGFLGMARAVKALTMRRLVWVEAASLIDKSQLQGIPAVATVPSDTFAPERATHAVFWDGRQILDPKTGVVTQGLPDSLIDVQLDIDHAGFREHDIPEGSWEKYVDAWQPVTLAGALGREYANGCLPWIEPMTAADIGLEDA